MNKTEISKIYDKIIIEDDKVLINSNKYRQIRRICDKKENELRDFIGKDGYRKFEDFMDEYCELTECENEYYFTKGFSVANKLRDESLSR